MNSNQGYPASKEGNGVANNSNSCEIGGRALDFPQLKYSLQS